VISVTDNGRGIEPEHFQTLFGRFAQLENQSRQSTSGFGLGLNIAKELVDLSFGRLTVESNLEKGSTFTFTLPIADPRDVVLLFLARLVSVHNGESQVSLLSAAALTEGNVHISEDIHFLLNDVLRSNDVLFRIDSDHWVIVLAANSTDVNAFRTRMAEMYEGVNRNRPRGVLPAITLVNHGSWDVPGTTEEFLAEFVRLGLPAESVQLCGKLAQA
jgi:hypothetical protein